jgi:hypothetical protein
VVDLVLDGAGHHDLNDTALLSPIADRFGHSTGPVSAARAFAAVRAVAVATAEAAALTRGVRQRAETTMRNVESVTADLAKATPQLPAIARNLEASTATLPQVLVQTQQTALEMERLLNQLRSHWLFGGLAGGGGNGRDNRDGRQPAREVRP